SGIIVTSYKDAANQRTFFDRIEADGTGASTFSIELNTSGITGGAPSVAIDNVGGFIYAASLYSPGAGEEHLEVKKFLLSDGSTIPGQVINKNLIGKERVEANGLIVDSARSLIVAGGSPRVGGGINQWTKQLNI